MTEEIRYGQQTPTKYFILPFEKSLGQEMIDLYEESGVKHEPWQLFMQNVINAVDDKGFWIHSEVGYSLPRRTGKTEILLPRMRKDMENGKKSLYTAHLVDTSHETAERLVQYLIDCGFNEVQRIKKDEIYIKGFTYLKQRGAERVSLIDENGTVIGRVDFRTRSGIGGLGKGYDTVYIDEAQEYTVDQITALKYVVSDSVNPQTILMGTPPTRVSKGTVFPDLRKATLAGRKKYNAWMEWSVEIFSDPYDKEAWYNTNPALGYHLTERKIEVEIGSDDEDFNIQRLGYWSKYNLASEISKQDWLSLAINDEPDLIGRPCIAIKFGYNEPYVAMAIACRTEDEKIYVEVLDCKDKKAGMDWIIDYLKHIDYEYLVIDGEDYYSMIDKALRENDLEDFKKISTPEFIEANSSFENAIFYKGDLRHGNQVSLNEVVSNTTKRAIGTKGGFGYICTKEGRTITLMESVIMAYWLRKKLEPEEQEEDFDIGY